jgi:hypothetical protein
VRDFGVEDGFADPAVEAKKAKAAASAAVTRNARFIPGAVIAVSSVDQDTPLKQRFER